MKTCKYCIAKYGFSLQDKDKIFETDDELFNHLEDWHGIIVVRENETEEQAIERCAKKGIVVDRAVCKCKDCQELRSEFSNVRLIPNPYVINADISKNRSEK